MEALPAKYGTPLCWLEGHSGLRPTGRTNGFRFRADGPCGSICAFRFALLTAFWIVFKLLIVEEDLFAGGKHEVVAAVHAFQDLIDEFHGLFSP